MQYFHPRAVRPAGLLGSNIGGLDHDQLPTCPSIVPADEYRRRRAGARNSAVTVTVAETADRSEPISVILRWLTHAQKSTHGVASYSRWVNRPLGRLFAALAFKVGATPNQVTLVAAVCTFVGPAMLVLLPATVSSGLIAAGLLVLGYALDAADGQLARLRGGGSISGEWLDHVLDCIKCSVLHLVVAVAWFRFFDLPALMLVVPLLYAAESAVWFFTIMLTDQLRRGAGVRPAVSMQRGVSQPAPVLRSVIVTPIDYGVLCLSFAVWGLHGIFAGTYTSLMLINIGVLAMTLIKWYREMSALGRSVSQ